MATLCEYMHWLRGQGGECRSGIGADPDRGMVPVIKLIAPSGRSVVHPGGDQGEILTPSIVDFYDRRLQMLSPFRSIPRA